MEKMFEKYAVPPQKSNSALIRRACWLCSVVKYHITF